MGPRSESESKRKLDGNSRKPASRLPSRLSVLTRVLCHDFRLQHSRDVVIVELDVVSCVIKRCPHQCILYLCI